MLVKAFVLLEGNEHEVRLALKLLRLLDETEDWDFDIFPIFSNFSLLLIDHKVYDCDLLRVFSFLLLGGKGV